MLNLFKRKPNMASFQLSDVHDSRLSDLADQVLAIGKESRDYFAATGDLFAMRQEMDAALSRSLNELRENPSREAMRAAMAAKQAVTLYDSLSSRGQFHTAETWPSEFARRHPEMPSLAQSLCLRVTELLTPLLEQSKANDSAHANALEIETVTSKRTREIEDVLKWAKSGNWQSASHLAGKYLTGDGQKR